MRVLRWISRQAAMAAPVLLFWRPYLAVVALAAPAAVSGLERAWGRLRGGR